MTYYGVYANDELYHHGIKGMKWGVRRYQNEDGTLTYAGKVRYGGVQNDDGSLKILKSDSKTTRTVKSDYNRMSDQEFMNKYSASKKTYLKRVQRQGDPYMHGPLAKAGKSLERTSQAAKSKIKETKAAIARIKSDPEFKKKTETAKKVAIGAAVVAGVALAAYGGYKLSKSESFNKAIANRYLKKADKSIYDYNLATKNATEFARRSRGFRSGMQYSNNADTVMKMHSRANANMQAAKSYLLDAEKHRRSASKYAGKATKYVNRAQAARYTGKKFTKTFGEYTYKTIRR